MHPVFRLVFAIALIMSGTLSVKAEWFLYAYGDTVLAYETSSDNTCYVSKNVDISGDLIIPETAVYNGKAYSVTSIGVAAFDQCRDMTSVTIPNSVTSIEIGAFGSCSGLTSVTIPNSVTLIDYGAFFGCYGLTSLMLPNSLTSIGDDAFWGCSGLTSVTIPNSVISIGSHAFHECRGLTSVTIPNSVTFIGGGAFWECEGLTSVTLPNSVTLIGQSAFSGCSGLTSVTIPNSVTEIKSSAFADCSNLSSVYYNCENPIKCNYGKIFDGSLENATLYVPEVAVEKCKVIYPWKDFKNIQAYDFSGVEAVGGDEAKSVTARYDMSGSHVDGDYKGIVIEHYSDGSTKKTIQK